MTRRWFGRTLLAGVAATALAAGLLPAAAGAAAQPRGISLQPRSFGAAPADVSVRGTDGNLVAVHRPGAAAAVAQQDFPQVMLDLRVTLPDDPAPSQVVATIINADDARKYAQTLELRGSEQRLSVPKGTYSVLIFSVGRDRAARTQVIRMGFAVDQQVTKTRTTVTVDLAAADADGFPNYRAPTGATTLDQLEFYELQDRAGRQLGGSWEIFGGFRVRLLVASTTGGTPGRLVSMNETIQRTSAPGRPLYYLSSAHPNAVVGDEQVSVRANAMTRVERHYYADGTTPESGATGRAPVYPYFDPGSASFESAPVPGVRDEYIFAPPGVVWFNDVQVSTASGGYADLNGFAQYPRGGQVREDLWRGPLAPGVQVQPPGARTYPYDGPRTCWVCRTATGMSVGLAPFVGAQANYGAGVYAGPGQRPHETHLTVYRDGAVVWDGINSTAGVFAGFPAQFPTPRGSADYRIVETANRAVDGMSLSRTATTEYDFTSSATSGPRLDGSWACGAIGAGRCTVLPLLSVQVPLPTSLTGSLPPGFSFLIANVGHVPGAAPASITSFDLAIKVGSSAWQPQTVESLGGGRYYVAIHNSAAPGTPVSMRWHAADAAGSSITQTVQDAYTIAAGQ